MQYDTAHHYCPNILINYVHLLILVYCFNAP